jgi:hypothetical protein
MNFSSTDPAMLWLSTVNLVLGLVCLVCVAVIGYGVVKEIAARIRLKAPLTGRELTHAFHVPDLGFTMADGGEPEPGRLPETGKRTR